MLGYVDVVCTALGGGLFDRAAIPAARSSARPACICGWRKAPMMCSSTATCTGYTMAFPVPGMYAQMQSNMAATLNIDWLLDLAREVLKRQGIERKPRAIFSMISTSALAIRARRALLYHPYISAGRRARAVSRCRRRGRCSPASTSPWASPTWCAACSRVWLRGARLLLRDGRLPQRGAADRRRCAVAGAAANSGEPLNATVRTRGARGSGRRRRGDDRRRPAAHLSDHGRLRRRTGSTHCSAPDDMPDTASAAVYDSAFRNLQANARETCARSGARMAARAARR